MGSCYLQEFHTTVIETCRVEERRQEEGEGEGGGKENLKFGRNNVELLLLFCRRNFVGRSDVEVESPKEFCCTKKIKNKKTKALHSWVTRELMKNDIFLEQWKIVFFINSTI